MMELCNVMDAKGAKGMLGNLTIGTDNMDMDMDTEPISEFHENTMAAKI